MTRIELNEETRQFVTHLETELNDDLYVSHIKPHLVDFYKSLVAHIRNEVKWLDDQTTKAEGWAKFDKEDELPIDAAYGIFLSRVMKHVQSELRILQNNMETTFRQLHEQTWNDSYSWLNKRYGGNIQFGNLERTRVINLENTKLIPRIKRNMISLKEKIQKIGVRAGSPERFVESLAFLHPFSHEYRGSWLDVMCSTDKHAHLIKSHLIGMSLHGGTNVRRLVTVDDKTSIDLCLPFVDTVYSITQAEGIVPAHDKCRCIMVPFTETIFVGDVPREVVI
jgi:hypothetical protein